MLDRRRIRQLSERESAALDERTPGSGRMSRREGSEGRVVEALPRDEVLELLRAHRRLER
jgi:hypothetical protein